MIQPKRSVFDMAMIVVNLVIGVGIFRTSAILAQSADYEPQNRTY